MVVDALKQFKFILSLKFEFRATVLSRGTHVIDDSCQSIILEMLTTHESHKITHKHFGVFASLALSEVPAGSSDRLGMGPEVPALARNFQDWERTAYTGSIGHVPGQVPEQVPAASGLGRKFRPSLPGTLLHVHSVACRKFRPWVGSSGTPSQST